MTLGEAIAYARDVKGWSLRELEKRTGISNAVISQIESGRVKDPGFRTVVKLAKVLGLKLDRLAKCEADRGA
jgi:transcriptional regulator with XRE-family HTH domain